MLKELTFININNSNQLLGLHVVESYAIELDSKLRNTYNLLLKKVLIENPQYIFLSYGNSIGQIDELVFLLKYFKKFQKKVIILSDYLVNDFHKGLLNQGLIEDYLINVDDADLKIFKETQDLNQLRKYKPQFITNDNNKNLMLVAPLAWNQDFPLLGLAYINASLKQENYNVHVIDCNLLFYKEVKIKDSSLFKKWDVWINNDSFKTYVQKYADKYIDQICDYINKNNILVVGFSVHYTSEICTLFFLEEIKRRCPHVKTLAGGPSLHDNFLKLAFKNNALDLGIKGEGEYTVKEAVKYLLGDKDVSTDSFILNNNGLPQYRPLSKYKNINDLISPDFSCFDVYDYATVSLPLSLSRGCVAQCSFCFETVFWKKYRTRRPHFLYNEMKYVAEKYKIRSFSINDSLMNGSHRLLEDFCDLIIEDKFYTRFYGYCRIDKKLTLPLLTKMAKAGCISVSFGIESGSDKILRLMDKGVEKKYIYPTLKNCKKAGIEDTTCCFIVGYPGETLYNYLETLFLIVRSLKLIDNLNLNIFQPSHETRFMSDPKKYNLIPSDSGWVSTEFWNKPSIIRIKYKVIDFIWTRYKKRIVSVGGLN